MPHSPPRVSPIVRCRTFRIFSRRTPTAASVLKPPHQNGMPFRTWPQADSIFVELTEMPKKKPAVTLPGTVEKIIPQEYAPQSEKVEISVEGADPLYKEIRIENTLQDEDGKQVA